jgi:hypothetical protein
VTIVPPTRPAKPTTATLAKGQSQLIEELDTPLPPNRQKLTNPKRVLFDPHPTYSSPNLNPKPPPPNVTLAYLEKLTRQATAGPDHLLLLHQTLFNLAPGEIPTIFGKTGFDTTLLLNFIDAILAMQTSDTKSAEITWVAKSIHLLEAIRKCGRFNIATMFAPAEEYLGVFSVLWDHATSEQKEQLDKVKSSWIQ